MDITRRKAISVFAAAAVMPFVGCAKTSETETAAQAAKEAKMKLTDKYAPGEAMLKKAEPNATFGKGLAMRGTTAQNDDEERTRRVREWLNQK